MAKETHPYRDFCGVHLCHPCWQGHDNHKNCTHGECECPCQKMEQNRYDDLAMRRAYKVANKKAQMKIDTGDDVINFGPATHDDRG